MAVFTEPRALRGFLIFLLVSCVCSQKVLAQIVGNCTANAGSARTVCASSVTLTGTVGGSLGAASPTWTFVSGPVTPVIASPNQLVTNVTGMTVDGNYRFRLSQPCSIGIPASSFVIITAHPRPQSFTAGSDMTNVCATVGTATLAGVIPTGFTGTWSVVSGPAGSSAAVVTPTDASSQVTGLTVSGTYIFRLTITSSDGGCLFTDDVDCLVTGTVTIGAVTQPTCRVSAGAVQLIDLPAGNWTISRTGTSSASIPGSGTTYTDSGLSPGSYTYSVTSDAGCTSADSPAQTITAREDCKPPLAFPVTYTLPSQPAANQVLTFDGSPGNPPAPGGFDAEDGPLGGNTTTSTLIIKTLPANGILYYDGQAVAAGDTIPGFDATRLTLELTGSGYQSVSFNYSFLDSSGLQGNIAPANVSWSQALPVTLVSFKAEKSGVIVSLSWVTSEEKNNTGFELLRSADASEWERIGFVKSQADKSYVKTTLTYTFQDTDPLKSTNYYRLKQIDYDGRYQLGPVRSVAMDANGETVLMYPNPTNDKLLVDGLSGYEVIRISSETGREVAVIRNETTKQKVVPLQSLKSGVYMITLTRTDGSTLTKRVVKF